MQPIIQFISDHHEAIESSASVGLMWMVREAHTLYTNWPAISAWCESRDGGLVPNAYRKLFGKPISPAIKP
jgi:hypothetical protein